MNEIRNGDGSALPEAPDTDWMVLTEARDEASRVQAFELLRSLDLDVPERTDHLHVFWLAEVGGVRAPWAAAAIDHAAGSAAAEIVAAGVATDLRSRGVGARLFAQLLDLLRARGAGSVSLVLRPSHAMRDSFLTAFGFTQESAVPGGTRYVLEL